MAREIKYIPRGWTETAELLIHEILHGIWDAQGLPAKVKEEDAVRQLAIGLVQVFRDNTELAKWIAKAARGGR